MELHINQLENEQGGSAEHCRRTQQIHNWRIIAPGVVPQFAAKTGLKLKVWLAAGACVHQEWENTNIAALVVLRDSRYPDLGSKANLRP